MSKKQFLKNISYNTVSLASVRIINVILMMYFSRYASIESFSSYGVAYNLFFSLSSLCIFGFGTSILDFISKNKPLNSISIEDYIKSTVIIVSSISILVSTVVFLYSEKLAFEVYNNVNFSKWFRYSSFLIFIFSLYNIGLSFLQGLLEFKLIAKIQISMGLLTALLQLILFNYYSMDGVFFALILSSFLLCLITYSIIIKKLKNSVLIVSLRSLYFVFHHSIPFSLSVIFVIPAAWIANIYISRNSGELELSIFQVSSYWQNIFMFIASSLSVVILSHLNNSDVTNSPERMRKFFQGLLVINLINFIGFFIVYFISDYIILGYAESLQNEKLLIILPYMFFAFSFNSMYLGQWVIASNLFKLSVLTNLIWLISYLSGVLFFDSYLDIDTYKIVYLSFYFSYSIQIVIFALSLIKNMRL
ncbi:hypothetical protein ACRN91_20550 [Shewanella baltica]|uniref:hypothetical protein n=1 Tax=Shewanella baltica TaxID=62322 RepID=UPI003D7BC389